MAGFDADMPMQNNGLNERMIDNPPPAKDTNNEAMLNTFIYRYFVTQGKYDVARALKDSGMQFDPPLDGSDSIQTNSKDRIDIARPGDLPNIKSIQSDGQGGSFLLSWFALFWDVYSAQRGHIQAGLQQDQQQHLLPGIPIGRNAVSIDYNNMMFHNGVNNDQDRLQPTFQQLPQMRTAPQENHSEMDLNGQRPRTPSNGDHAPWLRLDSMPTNGHGMMPNGRGLSTWIPGQIVRGDAAATGAAAQNLLVNTGINPGNLSEFQFQSFQQPNQNLRKNQSQQRTFTDSAVQDSRRYGPFPGPDRKGLPELLNFAQINPDSYHQMNCNGICYTSSFPTFHNGQCFPAQQGWMPSGNGWQQGHMTMIQQSPPMGTLQQRNEMSPPQAVDNATANGYPTSPTTTSYNKAKAAKERKRPKKGPTE